MDATIILICEHMLMPMLMVVIVTAMTAMMTMMLTTMIKVMKSVTLNLMMIYVVVRKRETKQGFEKKKSGRYPSGLIY